MSLYFLIGLVGIFSTIYTLNIKRENLELKRRIKDNTWINYKGTALTKLTINKVLEKYKSAHMANLNTEILESLIRIDSHNKTSTRRMANQIKFFESEFNEEIFLTWHSEGKICEESLRLFRDITILTSQKTSKDNKNKILLSNFLEKKKKKISNISKKISSDETNELIKL